MEVQPKTGVNNRVGKFLIATPAVSTGFFNRSVVFIYEDSLNGTAGLTINKPSGIDFADIAADRHLPYAHNQTYVYTGGPVNARAINMLHTDDWSSRNTLHTGTGLDISSDDVMIYKIAQGNEPNAYRLTAGASVWAPGQLDHEINSKQWLLLELPHSAVFDYKGVAQWENSIELYGHQFVSQWF
jgi:putative transcriptional regulator